MYSDYPILEFDPNPEAILSPHVDSMRGKLPEKAVLCFFQDILQEQFTHESLSKVGNLRSEIGENPIYTASIAEHTITVLHPGVGAALAAAFLEELIAAGVSKFVVCGGCGTLVNDLPAGHLLIPESAVRDEGTSYHYLPPSRECYPSRKVINTIEGTLEASSIPFLEVKTWTTDAFYRETVDKRERRIREGCRVVEMEAAALFAVAEFRRVELGMLLYAGDLVVPAGWKDRRWAGRRDTRALLFELALQACLNL
jgi:uridine phosphorylase